MTNNKNWADQIAKGRKLDEGSPTPTNQYQHQETARKQAA